MKIYIDVGHGGNDPGAVGQYEGFSITEKELNLIQANILEDMLQQYEGVETLKSRLTNDLSALYDADGIDHSAYRCNLWGGPEYPGGKVDLMISVHNNAATGSAVGYDVIHSVTQPSDLSEVIGREYEAIGRPKHAVFSRENDGGSDYYGIIRETINDHTRSIIIESVFVDNLSEVETWIWDVDTGKYRMDKIRQLMTAVTKGIAKFFNLVLKAPQPTVPADDAPLAKIRSIAVAVEEIKGDNMIVEITINGHLRTVTVPIKEA